MTHYKVLKEHIGFSGDYYAVGETFTHDDVRPIWIEKGFIEPYTPEPKHWRAENQGVFWSINENGDVIELHDFYLANRYEILYNTNNYYRTQATAELVAKARKLELEWLHIKDSDKKSMQTSQEICIAMDEARKAVLQDDGNE